MKIKLLLLSLVLILGLQGIGFAQAAGGTTDGKLNQFYPQDFNTWTATSIGSVASGAVTITVSSATTRITAAGGKSFNPFVANSTVLIDAGTSVAETDTIGTVTGSAPGNISFTTTTGSAHTGRFNINSGTYGLQEALDAAVQSGGGVVFVPPAYPGTTAMITGLLRGSSTVIVIDRRSTITPYLWSGSAYVASFIAGTGANGSSLNILTKTVTVAGSASATLTATNFIPAGSVVFGLTSYVTSTFSNTSLTSMKIGDGSTTDKFSSATMALTAGTTSNSATDGNMTAPFYSKAATSVVITGNGASFTTNGIIRLVLFYWTVTPPTS